MVLAHHGREAALELPEEIAEAAVAVALGVDVPVLLPEHHEVDARPLRLTCKRGPVRLHAPTQARLDAGVRKEALFESRIGDLGTERPGEARRLCALEIVLDGGSRDTEPSPDLACAHPLTGKAQHLSYLSHGQLSPGRHSVLLMAVEEWMPRLLTRGKPRRRSPTRWPASSRNGGRDQIGTVADIASE
jgi:hypothetical protein